MWQRIGVAVWALFLGAMTGMIMTFGHQARVAIGQIDVPWGIVVACLGTLAALIAARLLTEGRSFTLWLAIGIIATVAVLSLPGPNGTVLIPNGIIGLIWVFAPTALAVLVVLWPTRPIDRIAAVERTNS